MDELQTAITEDDLGGVCDVGQGNGSRCPLKVILI
jgi:hypothetical protein